MSAVKDSLDVLNQKYDIFIVGEGNVGISSFLYSYIYKEYVEDSELEVEELLTKTVWRGSRSYDISILGGSATQEYYLSSRKQQIKNTTALVFAYSISDRNSFAELEYLYERTMVLRGDSPPFSIVGLRADIEAERQVAYEEGYSLCERLGGVHFQECSAKDDIGVNEAFDPIIDAVLSLKFDKSNKKKNSITNKLGNTSKIKSVATTNAISKAASKLNKTNDHESLDDKKNQDNESRQVNQALSTSTSASLARGNRRNNYILPEHKKDLKKQGCCIIM
ncbi:uncharacterized protein AC631_02892 [Debaryomyces fabryi]|uniref:Uncharacterized protein n=1 Tax=Debaryomyces fabryi TaxID=58627 RepID=A0A0V1PZG5_9ASCO|nr:uncharacterized protein AC631_02892 [Debaryomyces fabryi]KSA01327.1 hypothetical protein AC631_02892 [Debaryomyces fabryi]CUM46664.1 unnamed protein product [Debaryomyces fabryi]